MNKKIKIIGISVIIILIVAVIAFGLASKQYDEKMIKEKRLKSYSSAVNISGDFEVKYDQVTILNQRYDEQKMIREISLYNQFRKDKKFTVETLQNEFDSFCNGMEESEVLEYYIEELNHIQDACRQYEIQVTDSGIWNEYVYIAWNYLEELYGVQELDYYEITTEDYIEAYEYAAEEIYKKYLAEIEPEETTDSAENETLTEEIDENTESQLVLELQSTDNPKVNVILNLSGTYTDIVGNTNNYVYQIPQFNADSDSAKLLNERIVEDLYDVINDEVQTMPTGCSLFCYSVTYEVVEYDNIVAIIASVPYPNDIFLRFAYSYDFANNKEVTNTELLSMRDITEEDFITESLRREKEYFQRQVDSIYPGTAEEEVNAWMQSAVNDTTVDLPMYMGPEGILYVYVPFPSLAGADWYYSLEQF